MDTMGNKACCKMRQEARDQSHTHEYLGSTKLAEENDEKHNHRFAGMTSEAVFVQGGNHYHTLLTNTDFFDHHHEIGGKTSLAIPVGGGKHVHLAEDNTTLVDGHFHEFIFVTLIDKPLI